MHFLITYQGITLCMKDWAAVFGINYTTVHMRITARGWDDIAAITTPAGSNQPMRVSKGWIKRRIRQLRREGK